MTLISSKYIVSKAFDSDPTLILHSYVPLKGTFNAATTHCIQTSVPSLGSAFFAYRKRVKKSLLVTKK